MRIICTMNDQSKARLLSAFLAGEGIDNQLELITNSDWGSSNYGDVTCKLWVYDEDQVPTANRWYELFQNDPNNPVFQKIAAKSPPIIPTVLPKEDDANVKPSPRNEEESIRSPITHYLLIICCILFFIDSTTTPIVTSLPKYLPPTPILASPLKKQTFYDYPHAFEIVDRLVKLYGTDKLQDPKDLPQEGQVLIQEFLSTPYWKGIYPTFLSSNENTQDHWTSHPPLFEKISQGQFWRLFSPCLMHNDILHLLFNMIWLVILGKQIEVRLKPTKYLSLILISGILSNTAQYLMSGSNFLGFSGVLCAMLSFIWMRQKYAPWEAYPLEKSTISFMLFFILAMFGVQLASFYLESMHQVSISPGIANTAHLSGIAVGILLGRLPLFSWKT